MWINDIYVATDIKTQVDLRVSSEATVRGFRVQYGRNQSTHQVAHCCTISYKRDHLIGKSTTHQEAVARAEALPGGGWGGRVVLRGLLPDSRYWVR